MNDENCQHKDANDSNSANPAGETCTVPNDGHQDGTQVRHPTFADWAAFAQESESMIKDVQKVVGYQNLSWHMQASDLEDIEGEILLRMVENWDRVPISEGFKGFTKTLAVHACSEYVTFRNRQTVIDPMVTTEAKTHTKARRLVSTLTCLAGQWPSSPARTEFAVIVSDCEREQNDGLRVLKLHWRDRFSMKEVAAMEGKSVRTCYENAKQTREQIKARYGEREEL